MFTNFKTSFAADKVTARAGANYEESGKSVSLRVESDFNDVLNIAERSVFKQNDFVFGVSSIFDLKTFGLSKYDFILGYQPKDKFSFFLTQYIMCFT